MLVILVFIRNLFASCFKCRDAAVKTTGPALVIVYAVFPISAATIFNTFMTESFDDGNERLTYDLSFDVTGPRYGVMSKYAFLMVCLHQRPRFENSSEGFDSKSEPRVESGGSHSGTAIM